VDTSRTSTVTDASRGPAAVGVKTTSALQIAPAGISLFRQSLPVTTNSDSFGPDVMKSSTWTGVPPTFRAVSLCDSLTWLTATGEKGRALRSSATAASDPPDVRITTPATIAETTTAEAPAVTAGPEMALCPTPAWTPVELA
jgi:hypothetical protein